MKILIPVDEKDKNANITNIFKNKTWAIVTLESGKVQNVDFIDDWTVGDEYIECAVVKSKTDHIWPFFEASIPVLEAPTQENIEEIMEAFIFKELYEVTM